MKISTDMAAELAEEIRVEMDEILHRHHYIMPDRVRTSIQDVLFWMLMTEAQQ